MAVLEDLSFLNAWQFQLAIFVLAVSLLYQGSRVFKYYFKLGVYYTLALLIGVGVIIYSLPRPRRTENHFFVAFMVRWLLCPLLGVDVIVKCLEHLDTDQPAIILINHQSSIDMLPMFSMWPGNAVCLAKKELWYTGTFGLGAWLCGTIYIDRLNHDRARQTMEDTSQLIKDRKHKVIVFPEGTRNTEGSLLPFKKGAFHLAVQAQVPIIPVVFSSYGMFYSTKEKRFDEGKVIAEVLPPIPTSGLGPSDVTDLTEKARGLMLEAFQRISEEVKGLN